MTATCKCRYLVHHAGPGALTKVGILFDSPSWLQGAMEQADGLSPGSEVHRLLASVRTHAKELFLGEKIKVRVLSPPFLFSARDIQRSPAIVRVWYI